MRNFTVGLLLVLAASAVPAAGDATPTGSSYMLVDHWGGTWSDAEKDAADPNDDEMCWAAIAANILDWTGWGDVGGMTNDDQMFQYYVDHWTNSGGMMEYAWAWWFDGNNYGPSFPPTWSQVDVPGGNFHPTEDFSDYYFEHTDEATAMFAVDDYLRAGLGVSVTVFAPGFAHGLTVWGFNYDPAKQGDPNGYLGIWVTNSGDDRDNPSPPDRLRNYELDNTGGVWHVQGFYDSNLYWINDVQALDRIPEPGALSLLALGVVGLLSRRPKLRKTRP